MPSSDYSSAIGGGLKLKGAKDAGIKKKKKKDKSSKSEKVNADVEGTNSEEPGKSAGADDSKALQKLLADEERDDAREDAKADEEDVREFGKTEAQRRHEERRRKRLDERLKREGIKTHKQRVEELNKYLSGLSEHHDMPRIGPG